MKLRPWTAEIRRVKLRTSIPIGFLASREVAPSEERREANSTERVISQLQKTEHTLVSKWKILIPILKYNLASCALLQKLAENSWKVLQCVENIVPIKMPLTPYTCPDCNGALLNLIPKFGSSSRLHWGPRANSPPLSPLLGGPEYMQEISSVLHHHF